MRIRVKVYGELLAYVPERRSEHELDVPQDATAATLLQELGIPKEEVWLIAVGQRQVDMGYAISEGEELSIFPPVTGG